ncbi:MAG TPA: aldo/keto reductase [Chthonomonadaceae bacterium]|nr:aldo/keto reductase [Chthonomonadaceae bacterium]
MQISRRNFLKGTAVAAGSLTTLSLAETASSAADQEGTLPRRVLGRTKEKVSILGIGMAPLGSNNTTTAQAEAVVHAALDQGITYIDVSPDYGNAEDKLKGVLKTRREGLFLVTKVNPDRQDRQGVQRQVEESLKRMGVAQVDAVHIHNLGDFDMDRLFTPDGAIAGLKEARERGLLRFIGTSGHMRPQRFATAIATGDIDLTMNALNFADRHNYDFEGLVLPVAQQHGTAVVAMKVLGGAKNWQYDGKTPGTLAEYHSRAIRYSLGLPGVACAVIGLSNAEEVKQAAEAARHYTPLSAAERSDLLAIGRRLAQARGLYYGPVNG